MVKKVLPLVSLIRLDLPLVAFSRPNLFFILPSSFCLASRPRWPCAAPRSFSYLNLPYRAILLTPPPSTYGVLGCLRRQRAFDKEPAAAALLAVPSGKIVCRVRLKSVD